MTTRKSGLGKNLNVFLSNAKKMNAIKEPKPKVGLEQLAIDKLQPGVYQPRRDMAQEGLNELSESIKQQGLLQPIVVRKLEKSDKYEIIAGERRWRASQLADLKQVPVIVHDVDDKTSLAIGIIENIQREDLNPIDEARGLERLINEFDLTHQQAAEVVSKSRASVSNLLRLMNLHIDVQLLLERGDIEMGHARALLSLELPKQIIMARQVVAKGYTVRETEAAIRRFLDAGDKLDVSDSLIVTHKKNAQLRQVQLSKELGNKVKIKPSPNGKFKVEINCDSLENLDRFIEKCSD
jgi:ParB family chromosome partitioning protein